MTATITATPGASDANSYLTLSAATDLAATEFNASAWDTASTDLRTRALLSATRYLEALSYIGQRATSTQALCWPRTDATTPEHTYSASEIPAPVKRAQLQIALALLNGTTLYAPAGGPGALIPGLPNNTLQRIKLDVMEVEWRRDTGRTTPLKALPEVQALLAPLLTSAPAGTIAVVRS